MKQYRATIAIGVIFAGLLIWVLATQRGRVPEKEELFGLQFEQITKLQVTQGKEEGEEEEAGSVLTLEKQGDEWYLSEPIKGLADPSTVDSMVKAFAQLEASHRPDTDTTKEEYGLKEPVLTVAGWWANGQQNAVITIGAEAPLGAKRYATIEGREGLFLVPTYFKVSMDKSADDLRDRKLTRIERDEVKQVAIAFDDKAIVAECRGSGGGSSEGPDEEREGLWQLVAPIKAAADKYILDSVIRAITTAEAAEFADWGKSPTDYGFDKPQATVTLTTKDGKATVFVLGKEIEKEVKKRYGEGTETKQLVYAQREGRDEVLLVESSIVPDVRRDEFALRDKHVVRIEKDKVMRLRVQAKDRYSFEAAKVGDEWQLTTAGGGGIALQTSKIDAILWDVEDLEATSYVEEKPQDLGKYGLTVPQVVLSLSIQGRSKPLKLYFGDQFEADTTIYMRTSEGEQVYTVPNSIIESLPKTREDLKSSETAYDSGTNEEWGEE